MTTCKQCNTEFIPYRKTSLYCSKKCNSRANYNRNRKTKRSSKICGQCSIVFSGKNTNAQFCSKKCANKSFDLKNPGKYAKLKMEWRLNNPEYGKEHYIKNKKRYNFLNKKWKLNNPKVVNANNSKRRARKLNATILGYDEEYTKIVLKDIT